MTRPTPFCPSLEPCEKLTLVHVSISMVRIHGGGGAFFLGSLNSVEPYEVFLVRLRIMNIRMMVTEKPISGESSSDSPMSWAFDQFTAVSLAPRSEEHTSELQSRENLVCRLLLEKKKQRN